MNMMYDEVSPGHVGYHPIGGGSAIDCAKGIAALGGLPVRLVAVPTTSGSGSTSPPSRAS